MGLLEIIAAGGAMGARDASNMNVRAQNELEIRNAANNMEMDREMLRQKYLDKRYQVQRADAKEMATQQGLLAERKSKTDRENKIEDDERKHKQNLELAEFKESKKDKRFADKIAAGLGSSGGSGKAAGGNVIQLEDGTLFTPNDADSKNAANLVRIGAAKNIREGYEIIYAQRFSSQAAGTMGGLQSGVVPESKNMSRALLNGSAIADAPITERLKFNPKTGGF